MNSKYRQSIEEDVSTLQEYMCDIEDKYDTLNMDFMRYRINQAIQTDELLEKIDKLEELLLRLILKKEL